MTSRNGHYYMVSYVGRSGNRTRRRLTSPAEVAKTVESLLHGGWTYIGITAPSKEKDDTRAPGIDSAVGMDAARSDD